MEKTTFRDRLNYWFDTFMSRGTLALLAGLAVASAVMIVVIVGILTLSGAAEGKGFGELAWMGLLRTLDTGTMGGDEGSIGFLGGMLAITLGGVFTVSTLIGILNNGLEDKLDTLRKGRSRVIENNHTVILGWSDQIFPILSELAVANANQRDACVVILGDQDKVEMEEAIQDKLGSTGKMRIICRNGNPIDPLDLRLVNLNASRAIVLLASEGEGSDANIIKALLAITNSPNRRPAPYHIVAEMNDPRNLEVARMVGKEEVEVVMVGNLVARIIAQTCRQSGLSLVYNELLDFGGDEIYFQAEPQLAGKTFGEALLAYEDCAVIGVRRAGAQPQLNPAMDLRLTAGDQLIVVAEDDDKIKLPAAPGRPDPAAIQLRDPARPAPERTLILGWNHRAVTIINELDNYVAPGSEVFVVAEQAAVEAEIAAECAGLKNQSVRFQADDTTERRVLDGLQAETYQHIIVLAYSDQLDVQPADARTLITLLHLRDISDRLGRAFSIVTEMLDTRNRDLAEVTHADDFIVSDRLISLIMAQVAENKALNAVFADLFDPEGAEVYLKPAANYVKLGQAINFYTVVEAARQRNETALGYRLAALSGNAAQSYGVVVNPDKSNLVTFGEKDKIVVLAEN